MSHLIGKSEHFEQARRKTVAIANSEAPVLITGESGTGKGLFARTLHDSGPRVHGPYNTVSCATFAETLETELFGVSQEREGYLSSSSGGTLVLDEIGEMPLSTQAKLLRVLQEGYFSPSGSSERVPLNVRLIATSTRPLNERVAQGRFREDLYYRIKAMSLELPPLRERGADLVLLVEHFIGLASNGTPVSLSDEARSRLEQHSYPGNIRELKHAVEQAVLLAGAEPSHVIRAEHLPSEFLKLAVDEELPVVPLRTAVKDFERRCLLHALRHAGGNRTRTARLLNISRKNLWEKLRAHQVTDSEIAAVMASGH